MLPPNWPHKPQATPYQGWCASIWVIYVLQKCEIGQLDHSQSSFMPDHTGHLLTALHSGVCSDSVKSLLALSSLYYILSHSLTCHNLGCWGTKLAVKLLFLFWKMSLEGGTCVSSCKFLGTKTVIQRLLVFSLFSTCPWGSVPVVPQLCFAGLQKSSQQLVGASLLPLQIFHQGYKWVKCSWDSETLLRPRKFEKFSFKTCQINEILFLNPQRIQLA